MLLSASARSIPTRWVFPSTYVIGSNSAVGVAVKNPSRMGRSNGFGAYSMNRFKSVLLIEPTFKFSLA